MTTPAGDRLRILMLNHNVVWRSTFFRAFALGRELADLGHEVTLATISRHGRFRPDEHVLEGVRVVETPDWGVGLARTGWDPWDAAWRTRRFGADDFDVVHGFDCRPVVLLPSLALQRRGVPWVSDWADCWGGEGGAISQRKSWAGRVAFRPLETWLEEGFRHRAQAVTVTSRTLLERALGFGIPKSRVHYLPSGANVRSVSVRDRAASRRELALPGDVPIACFVGFVQYDLEVAIRGFAHARKLVPEAHLVLVGPRNSAASRLARRLGLGESVHEAGAQPFDRIPTFLGASDVLLLPMSDNLMNRARGPIKLGDYLASGRPTLSNPVGEVVEILQQGDVGVLAPDSPEAYGSAMAQLLADPDRCRRLGRNARALAETRLSWSLRGRELDAIYWGLSRR